MDILPNRIGNVNYNFNDNNNGKNNSKKQLSTTKTRIVGNNYVTVVPSEQQKTENEPEIELSHLFFLRGDPYH